MSKQTFVYKDFGNGGKGADCVIRAFVFATGKTFVAVCKMLRVPYDKKTGRVSDDYEGYRWGDVVRIGKAEMRYIEYFKFTKNLRGKITVDDICRVSKKNPKLKNKKLIVGCEGKRKGKLLGHATCVENGKIYDLFDCGNWIVDSLIIFDGNGKSILPRGL